MLSTKDIKLRKVMKKLSDRFIGPFKVLKKVGANAYQLELPQQYGRLHSTFYVSLLQAYYARPGQKAPEPIEIDREEEYVVEQILDAYGKGRKRRWLVKWEGWSCDHNIWEPIEHLENAIELVRAFDAKAKRGRG